MYSGGVVGHARTSYDGQSPIVGFDMGGTSTDVSRYGGSFEHVFETVTAGVSIQSPQLDINTVAAGGGSMLFWQNGMFKVGPEVRCFNLNRALFYSVFVKWLLTESQSRVLEPTQALLLIEKEARSQSQTPTSCKSNLLQLLSEVYH